MGKKVFIALMIISIFFISACDIYNTLYIQEGAETVEVPEGDIIMEGIDDEEEVEEWEDTDIVEIIDAEEDADEEGI